MKRIKLTTVSDISQIISALAVVISLVYIGTQITQNTKATQSAIRQSIADNDITYLMSSLDNSIVAVASYKLESKIELTDLEMSQLVSMQHVNFRVFENAFYQFEQGLLEAETWTRYRIIIKDLLKTNDASKKMWVNYADSFTESFQDEIKQLINTDKLLIDDVKIVSGDTISKIK